MKTSLFDVIKKMQGSNKSHYKEKLNINSNELSDAFDQLLSIGINPVDNSLKKHNNESMDAGIYKNPLFLKNDLEKHKLIADIDLYINEKNNKKTNLDSIDESGASHDTKLILPKLMKDKIESIINIMRQGMVNNKKLPVIVLNGDQGLGKKKIIKTIIDGIGRDSSELVFNSLKGDKSKKVFIFNEMSSLDESISYKEPGMIIFLDYKPERQKYFWEKNVEASLSNFLDSNFNLLLKVDETLYKEEKIANELIDEMKKVFNINCLLNKESFDKGLVAVTPNNVYKVCQNAALRADLLGTDVSIEILDSIFSENVKEVKEVSQSSCDIIKPNKKMGDIVLCEQIDKQLKTLFFSAQSIGAKRYEFQKKLRGSNSRLVALFTGMPGTGKSLCAEVLAGELGTELWSIDFSQVLDKFVGETEKILTDIFKSAKAAKAVLRLDEADAFLSKRSGSEPSWVITQKNHLLNLIENYEGVLILTTNRADSIDPAFSRRIDFKIEFPLPDVESMKLIIQGLLEPDAPLELNFNYDVVMDGIKPMSGGFIRNAIERCWLECVQQSKLEITAIDLNSSLKAIQNENNLIEVKTAKIGLVVS